MSRRSAARRGYGAKWRRESRAYLERNRICVLCRKPVRLHADRGDPMLGVVDHKVPHRGDQRLFWDRDNWQTMHKGCHDGPKRYEEHRGRVRGCNEDGTPLDASHHWRGGGEEGGASSAGDRKRSGTVCSLRAQHRNSNLGKT
jgi:5-methylcytosine-specific restriction endonuclease McrA